MSRLFWSPALSRYTQLQTTVKKELRSKLRHVLSELGPDRIRERSQAAAHLFLSTPEYKHAEIMMTYLSMHSEVDTAAIVARAWQDRKRVVAPMVSWEAHQMIPVEINSLEDTFMDGESGLRQPDGQPIPVELIDLVIVPGLGFDPFGNRLGRGRGFYDRFLGQKSFRAVSCGLALEEQVVGSIPAGPLDVPIHMLVTDVTVRRFSMPKRIEPSSVI